MAIVKKRKPTADGSIQYDVFKDGKLVAHVYKGWMSPGGEQWIAKMMFAKEFGEPTIKKLLTEIDRRT